MAQPSDPAQELALAEQWWKVADRESRLEKPAVQARAVLWCQRAVAGLSGLEKIKAEKLLERLVADVQSAEPKVRGTVQAGNVALAANGTTVAGPAGGAQFLLDGKTSDYTGTTGFASSKWPCQWIFNFKDVYRLQEIRFLMWSLSPRYCRYVVETSADGLEYTVLVDRSQGQWSGWQRVVFPPQPVKTVRLRGLYNNVNDYFHMAEFEAYCIPPLSPPR